MPGPLAVPGREDEQPGPMACWTGWGVRGDWQLAELLHRLCAGMSHHLPLLLSPKGFVAFPLLLEDSSRRQRPKTVGLQGLAHREGESQANQASESLSVHTSKALNWQLPWAGKEMCQVRCEPGVAKNPVEQEEHHALGPRSDCACQITVWAGGVLPACPLGHPSPWLKSCSQLLGLLQGLSCEREVPLSPRLWKMLWCPGTSGAAQVAEQLLFCHHLLGAQPLARPPISWHGLPVPPALGRQCAAAGAVVVSHQMQNDGQANASLSGTWVGTKEHHWQSSGDELHSSFGMYPKLPVVERSRMLVAMLQMRGV